MNLVDIHCHLNHESFRKDLNEVIERAKKAGLKAIIVSGTNPASNQQVLELAQKDPLIKISLGLHPIDALGLSEGETGIPKQKKPVNLEKEFHFIKEHKDQILAIGEAGLDYHWDKEHHQQQKDNFRKIIQFAVKIKKPIIIHTWDAEEDCLDILEEENPSVPVILHCFGGRKSLITRAKELGYYFSVPPSIIKGNFQTLVKKVPLTQLLTETDAPWQSPSPDIKRNEPAFIVETIKKISEIKKLSQEEVADQIWKNYQNLIKNKHV